MNEPKEIAIVLRDCGIKKAKLPVIKLLLFSILAGAFVALASVGANTVTSMIENQGIGKLIGGLIFPAGLIMIIIAGAELFTGDCLMIISVLEKKITWAAMLRSWLVVYFGNFIGSVLIAYLVYRGNQFSLFSGQLGVYTMKVAAAKTTLSFDSALILGILCNFLVCIAVWMNYAGRSVWDKIVGAYFPVVLFVISGFEHCVANMYSVPAGLFAKNNEGYTELAAMSGIDLSALTWSDFFVKNLLPVTLGNIIGGAVLVGGVYWYLYLKDAEEKRKKMIYND